MAEEGGDDGGASEETVSLDTVWLLLLLVGTGNGEVRSVTSGYGYL